MLFGAFQLSIIQNRLFSLYVLIISIVCSSIQYIATGSNTAADLILTLAVFSFSLFALTNLCESLSILRNRLRENNAQLKDAIGAKDIFLANMSHEIRTPINGVIGMLEAIGRTELTKQQSHFTNTAQSSANILLVLVNDILDLSKIQSGKMSTEEIEFDFQQEMDSVINDFAFRAEQKNLMCLVSYDLDIPQFLRGDPTRIKQILFNLLGNAIKFTSKGEVRIQVSAEEVIGDQLSLRFQITDTGIGIPTEKHSQLFNSFTQVDDSTTRHYGGTGLGLAICQQLCHTMGGSIDVESEVGKGSKFSFHIPLLISNGGSIPKTSLISMKNRISNIDVFLVDSRSNRNKHTQALFSSLGFSVYSVESEQEFIELIKEYENDTKKTQIIILNETVFGNHTIVELKKNLASQLPNSIWIKSDSLFQMPSNDEILSLGYDNYLHYPLKPYSLFTEIRRIESGALQTDIPQNQTLSTKNIIDQSAHLLLPDTSTSGGSILLVDDNKINQEVGSITLESLGYSSIKADNGAQALGLISQNRNQFSLILMDCQMPIMDGYETTQAIRLLEKTRGLARLPIIAMTANASPDEIKKSIAAGMDAHLSKPITTVKVKETLAQFLTSTDTFTTQT
ncbi:MAG: ATP-binding protein [Pseudohongiellaceae bacterium]